MALNTTIELAVAQLWAERWNKDMNALKGIKAFKILGPNVTSIMKQPGIVDIRAYMGIRDDGTPTLILVGIDEKGNDVINPAKGYHIYDYTEPCPNCCSAATLPINPH